MAATAIEAKTTTSTATCVDVEEVGRQDSLGLRGQELPPGQPGTARRWPLRWAVRLLADHPVLHLRHYSQDRQEDLHLR